MGTLVQDTFIDSKLEPYRNPQDARTESFMMIPSVTILKGVVVGIVTASNKLKAYASGNSDGSEIPVGLMQYDVTTDANGFATIGSKEGVQESYDSAPIYVSGAFLISDLTGADANAQGLLGRTVDGVLMMEGK